MPAQAPGLQALTHQLSGIAGNAWPPPGTRQCLQWGREQFELLLLGSGFQGVLLLQELSMDEIVQWTALAKQLKSPGQAGCSMHMPIMTKVGSYWHAWAVHHTNG